MVSYPPPFSHLPSFIAPLTSCWHSHTWWKINTFREGEGFRQDKEPKKKKGVGGWGEEARRQLCHHAWDQGIQTGQSSSSITSPTNYTLSCHAVHYNSEKYKRFKTWVSSGDVRKELENSCSQRHQTTLPDARRYQDNWATPHVENMSLPEDCWGNSLQWFINS